MKEKLLVLTPFIPYPLNTGGNHGTFHMLNFVKDYYEVFLWFHINNEKKEKPTIDALNKALDGKVHIHYTANKIGKNFTTYRAIDRKLQAKLLKDDIQYSHTMILGGPLEMGSMDYQNLIDIMNIIKDNDIHYVQMEYSNMRDMVYIMPYNVKKVFINHEIHYARIGTYYNEMKNKTPFDLYRYRRFFDSDINALNKYDCVITMSDVDKEMLIKDGVKTKVESSPSFIPSSRKEFPTIKTTKKRLTFIGVGSHLPNYDGLLWFIKYIHPVLKSKVGDYQLDIIGKGWNELENSNLTPSNFNFLGFVDDLANVIPGSVMIVPIRTGSGMRMKILESVNYCVPFISCKVGAEGMGFVDGENCFIEDDASKFADKLVKLLNDEKLQEKFVMEARVHYNKTYSPNVLANRRLSILQSIFK